MNQHSDGRSLAYRTELTLRRAEGSEVCAGVWPGVTVIRTPAQPDFWWGNFLLMARPPRPGEGSAWLALSAEAVPDAQHVAFGIDTADGEVGAAGEFAALGFEVIRYSVLTCAQTRPHDRLDTGHDLRPLSSDADWQAMQHFQVEMEAAESGTVPGDAQQDFIRARLARLRALSEGGHGAVWGAFASGGPMLAGLGVYRGGDGLARYQSVETLPAARGRGLASALVHAAGEWARTHLDARTLVIAADPEYHAQRLYERLGFVSSEVQVGFLRRTAADRPDPES